MERQEYNLCRTKQANANSFSVSLYQPYKYLGDLDSLWFTQQESTIMEFMGIVVNLMFSFYQTMRKRLFLR